MAVSRIHEVLHAPVRPELDDRVEPCHTVKPPVVTWMRQRVSNSAKGSDGCLEGGQSVRDIGRISESRTDRPGQVLQARELIHVVVDVVAQVTA